MKLHCLTITNFGSFRGEQVFRFPEKPGLYFMQGVNTHEPRLEANGSGKTTIWRALTWLLYGKDSKGMKASDVCNWDVGKTAKVTLSFQTEDKLGMAEMKRTWAPNAWTLTDLLGNTTDLAKDKSNPILALIKLEFTPFLNCILMSQGQPMFLDLDHVKKAELFSDVMGLDKWLDHSKTASIKAATQDAISRRLERDLSSLLGEITSYDNSDILENVRTWEDAWKLRRIELETKYAKKIKAREDLKAAVNSAENIKVKCKRARDEYLRVVDAAKDTLESFDLKLTVLERGLADAKTRYDVLIEARESIQDGVCPTCGQKVALHAHVPSAEDAKIALNKKNEIERELKKIVDAYECALQKDQNARKELQCLNDHLFNAEDNAKNKNRELQQIDRELDVLEDQAESLAIEKNPYAELHASATKKREDIQERIHSTQRLLDDSNRRYSLFSFWVRGFKELRLQLIAEALNELEIEVNNEVMALGLLNWELNFQVDRETKSGNVQRGFNVVVGSPHNNVSVPWEAWSGGEAQRLRVAAQEGLANLIRNRTQTKMNLEVWDEPTQGLSQQGVRDLLDALAARADTEGRQIWIVDHQSHSFGGFAGGAVVTKTRRGSAITQY